jgi:two-component system CheB/CheR fusion protein
MPVISPQRRTSGGKPPNGRAQRRDDPSGTRPDTPARARRVLVVEDNLDTLRSMTLLLREMGHQVEYAINGYAALEVARRFRPEVVFLDLGLPGMDGFELCRQMKRDAELKSARVIAITGYGQEEYRRRSQEAGCEAHLVKPVEAQVLKALLE